MGALTTFLAIGGRPAVAATAGSPRGFALRNGVPTTRRRLFFLATAAAALAAALPAQAAPTVQDVVDQISQPHYTDYLNNQLFTHAGDGRSCSANQRYQEHNLARDNIQAVFSGAGWSTTINYDTNDWHYSQNVVAVKPGTVHPDRQYIVGAHYDSEGSSYGAPGADDNASGTAALLELARALSNYSFESTIILIAFDQEETGTHGSSGYADAAKARGDDIRAMFSLDMIAYNPGGADHDKVRLNANDTFSLALKNALYDAVDAYSALTPVKAGESNNSDHRGFQNQGYAAVHVNEYSTANPYNHQATDSVDTANYIDYAFATDVTRGVAGYLATYAVVVPEPGTILLLAFGGGLIGAAVRRRRAA